MPAPQLLPLLQKIHLTHCAGSPTTSVIDEESLRRMDVMAGNAETKEDLFEAWLLKQVRSSRSGISAKRRF